MRKVFRKRAFFLLFCGVAVFLGGCQCGSPDPAYGDFSAVCRRYAPAVALITYTIIDENGQEFCWQNETAEIKPVVNLATAFAVGPHEFVTNAHVATAMQGLETTIGKDVAAAICEGEAEAAAAEAGVSYEEYCKAHQTELDARLAAAEKRYAALRIRGPELRLSHSGGKTLTVTALQIHPDYRDEAVDDAEQIAHGECDAALLITAEAADCWFPVAGKTELEQLGAGMRVGALGFPMEGLFADGGINLAAPEATFKDGSIGKVTGADFIFGSFEHNRTITHNIPQIEGASGSPLFRIDGKVVAILWGTSVLNSGNSAGESVSFVNPVQQNLALRIDALESVRKVPQISAPEWLRMVRPAPEK